MDKYMGSSGTGIGRTGRYKMDPEGGYWLFLPLLCLVGRMKTRALLTDGN